MSDNPLLCFQSDVVLQSRNGPYLRRRWVA